nr:hypothetical protein [Tanacetum cinerariifolium]
MQRLLPYGLQNYLPDKIAKPIIELCSLFKQICSAALMEDDMLKAQIKVVDILCDFDLIYPSALFDIMIHLVIHLPLEALEGVPIRPRWMYPFKRYMKKLKGYVRNKAKPEGSIAEGYVAEEALTFSSHYFWDVTTKFNRLDRNVYPPLPTCQFQVFQSIRQRHVDNDKDLEVSTTSELFALACGPTWTPISLNSCVVDGVSRNERRITQNSGICSPGPDGEMYYDIIDVDEDDDIIDDKDMSADVAKGHGGDGEGDDRPPPHESAEGCRGKGTRKPNLGGRKAGRMHTRKETRNLGLRKIMDELGPQPIRFEWKDNGTMLPLGKNSTHWANLLGEIVRGFLMHFGSWRNILPERKAGVLEKIEIKMRRFGFGLIPRTWPGVLKMLEIGQRARSYAGRDPRHLLPSEICRVRGLRFRSKFVIFIRRCRISDIDISGVNVCINDKSSLHILIVVILIALHIVLD